MKLLTLILAYPQILWHIFRYPFTTTIGEYDEEKKKWIFREVEY